MNFRQKSIHFILILLLKVNSAKTVSFQNERDVPEFSQAKFKITKDDTLCEKQVLLLVGGYQRKELWALKVLDAWGKSQSGLFSGNTINFGHYEQCLEIKIKFDDPADGNFYGQHCMVFFENDPEAVDVVRNQTSSIADLILPQVIHIDILRQYMNVLKVNMATSICVPSLCTAEKVKVIANRMLRVHKMKTMDFYDQEVLCNTVNIMEMRSIDMLAA
jgi:hypothetical protein